jgi:hypothetical protein
MTTGPINPVECAANAIRAGLLVRPGNTPARKHWPNEEFDYKVRLPSEIGLSPIRPTPQADGRSREALGLRPLKANNRPRYVITKSQRPDLFK